MNHPADVRFTGPLYTVGEAATFLRVPRSTMATWAGGYTRRRLGGASTKAGPVVTAFRGAGAASHTLRGARRGGGGCGIPPCRRLPTAHQASSGLSGSSASSTSSRRGASTQTAASCCSTTRSGISTKPFGAGAFLEIRPGPGPVAVGSFREARNGDWMRKQATRYAGAVVGTEDPALPWRVLAPGAPRSRLRPST